MAEISNLEVFQDLHLTGPTQEHSKLREALLSLTRPPWRHDVEKEEELSEHAGNDDVLVFERTLSGGLPAAGLVLWSTVKGYSITNIVPIESGQLSYASYNAILQDFARHIAEPAAKQVGFKLETTAPRKTLGDWLTPSTAEALRRFSTLANKSTGASHPLDKGRWLTFLIAAYQDRHEFDAGLLVRWLIEVEHWPDDTAHDLAIEYEFALELLEQYDKTQ